MANIEDIDYLKQHSEINYKNLLIDSSYRNLNIYPYSSYYSINLEYPIYNVVNIKIDQAFVPNAVTTIHPYNRTFIFKSGFTCNKRERLKHTIYLKIKDYNIVDMINYVADGNYNLYSLLSDYDIVPSSYLFSDTFNSDLNFLQFSSGLPFIFDMENSTSRRSFGFNEYSESKYDLDLYPNKLEHGLYKLDSDESKRIFMSYPTNNYNSTTYTISTSTSNDSYSRLDATNHSTYIQEITTSGYDIKTVLTDGVDTDGIFTYSIIGEIPEYTNRYNADITSDDGTTYTETASTYSLADGATAFQTISMLSSYDMPDKSTSPDTATTYVQIVKKIRALLDSTHWSDGASPISLTSSNLGDITWEIYECSDYTTTGGRFLSYHQCSPFTNHVDGNSIIDDMYRISSLSSTSYSNPTNFTDINTTLNSLVSGATLVVNYLIIINHNISYIITEINNNTDNNNVPYIKLQNIVDNLYTTYTYLEFVNTVTSLTICTTSSSQIYSLAYGSMITEDETATTTKYTGQPPNVSFSTKYARYLVTYKDTYDSSTNLDNNSTEYIGKIIWASTGENAVTTSSSPTINTKEASYKSNIFYCIAITNNTGSSITLTTCTNSGSSFNNDKFVYSSLPLDSSKNAFLKLAYVARTHAMATNYEKLPMLGYERHMIVSPNVASLVGSKYVKLRCEEIENLVDDTNFASGNFSPGLALFNTVAISKIYNNVATNFHSIDYKNFHPIGKLTRLTFKFEDEFGNLVDFKGLEHHFTLLISYLVPLQKEFFKKSILNPNYDGNFIQYLRYKEEREEQINVLNLQNPQKFLNKEIDLIKEFETDFNDFVEKTKRDNNYFNDENLNYTNTIIKNSEENSDENSDEGDSYYNNSDDSKENDDSEED